MSNLTLQLEGDALREAIAQSILGQLTPEAQRELLDQAIQEILKPSTNSWNKGQTPLERAFVNAVQHIANQEAKRLLSEDEDFKARMQDLMRTTADKVFTMDQDKLAERMANAFVASIERDVV